MKFLLTLRRRLLTQLRQATAKAPPYPLCDDEWEFSQRREAEREQPAATAPLAEAPPTDAEFLEAIAALARIHPQPE